jgi:FkbM family methyltransferase
MSRWFDPISLRLRDVVLRHYLVPYSPFGLEAGLVEHLPRHKPVSLIDVGANRGDFAAAVRAHCGLEAALLIEPQPALADGLRARFPEETCRVCNVALSDVSGTQPFSILGADSCSSLLTVKPDAGFAGREIDTTVIEQREVQVARFDDLIESEGWTRKVDLLKIDTQGNELQVMRAGRRALKQVHLLWIEVSFRSLYEGDALFPEIHAFLTGEGFRFYSLHEVFRSANRELLQADALFLGPQ